VWDLRLALPILAEKTDVATLVSGDCTGSRLAFLSFCPQLPQLAHRDILHRRMAVSADTRCLKIEFGSMCDDRTCCVAALPTTRPTAQSENARGERAFSVVDLG
jgi:hypothetical protein